MRQFKNRFTIAASIIYFFAHLFSIAEAEEVAVNPWRPLRIVDSCELDFD
jgi:hypothetical protein